MLTQQELDGVIAFHGHSCPGLAFGIRAADWALQEFGRAEDEEIVAVVESDMCAVDAIQFLIGCTFGKGNLVFLDYGKNAFSFFRRSDGKNARLMSRGGLLLDLREEEKTLHEDDKEGRERIRRRMIDRVMQVDFETIFSVGPARISMPEKARIHQSIRCAQCDELTMETRLLDVDGRKLCVPCRSKEDCASH